MRAFFSHIIFAAAILFVALGFWVVLGINYTTVAVSRGGSLFSI